MTDRVDVMLMDVSGITPTGTDILVITEDDAVENDVADNGNIVADVITPPVSHRRISDR